MKLDKSSIEIVPEKLSRHFKKLWYRAWNLSPFCVPAKVTKLIGLKNNRILSPINLVTFAGTQNEIPLYSSHSDDITPNTIFYICLTVYKFLTLTKINFSKYVAPFGKRSWKMFYCTLRDMVLYLHKDERGFHKNQVSEFKIKIVFSQSVEKKFKFFVNVSLVSATFVSSKMHLSLTKFKSQLL
jgi:hypothetical protein